MELLLFRPGLPDQRVSDCPNVSVLRPGLPRNHLACFGWLHLPADKRADMPKPGVSAQAVARDFSHRQRPAPSRRRCAVTASEGDA